MIIAKEVTVNSAALEGGVVNNGQTNNVKIGNSTDAEENKIHSRIRSIISFMAVSILALAFISFVLNLYSKFGEAGIALVKTLAELFCLIQKVVI